MSYNFSGKPKSYFQVSAKVCHKSGQREHDKELMQLAFFSCKELKKNGKEKAVALLFLCAIYERHDSDTATYGC